MMPKDFLEEQLAKISKDFPNVHIKYAFNNIISTHIVELLPLSEYLNNDALGDVWIPLSFEFREKFPEEEISFVSSDSTLSIKESIFEFNVPKQLSCFGDISALFEPIIQNELYLTFPEFMPVVAVAIGASITEVLNSPKQKMEEQPDMNNYYQDAA